MNSASRIYDAFAGPESDSDTSKVKPPSRNSETERDREIQAEEKINLWRKTKEYARLGEKTRRLIE